MEALRSLQDALRGRRGVSMICGFIMLTIAGTSDAPRSVSLFTRTRPEQLFCPLYLVLHYWEEVRSPRSASLSN